MCGPVSLGADVEVSTASADVEGRGDFGALEVNTASGDVGFDQVGGEAEVNSASGDVKIPAGSGRITVNTAQVTWRSAASEEMGRFARPGRRRDRFGRCVAEDSDGLG